MIHGGLRRMLVDGFPFAGTHVEGKGRRGRLRGHSVVSHAVVVVRIVGPAGEINLLVFFRAPRRDAVACGSRMAGQLCPLNFQTIMVVDLAYPAFVGSYVPRLASGWVLVRAVNVHNGVTYHGTGVSEHGRSGDRRGLCPDVLLCVVPLNVMHCVGFRPAAHKIDVSLTIESADGIVHRYRHVLSTEPAIGKRLIRVDVAQGSFPAL